MPPILLDADTVLPYLSALSRSEVWVTYSQPSSANMKSKITEIHTSSVLNGVPPWVAWRNLLHAAPSLLGRDSSLSSSVSVLVKPPVSHRGRVWLIRGTVAVSACLCSSTPFFYFIVTPKHKDGNAGIQRHPERLPGASCKWTAESIPQCGEKERRRKKLVCQGC